MVKLDRHFAVPFFSYTRIGSVTLMKLFEFNIYKNIGDSFHINFYPILSFIHFGKDFNSFVLFGFEIFATFTEDYTICGRSFKWRK